MSEKEKNSWAVFFKENPENDGNEERLLTYWINFNRPETEAIKKAAEAFARNCSETEAAVEKTPMWSIKNQAVTTKILPFFPQEKRRKAEDQKVYIISLLKNDIYDPGTVTELQLYVENQLKIDKEKTQSVLQSIYLEEFEHTSLFVNLLQVISQIEYKMIEPAGPIMALAATRHWDCEVREYGLRCYENWEDPACLSVLKALYFEEKWLQNYLEMLIADFEEGE
ncbi:hypothetical protein [Acetivibrio ethanolgignens]|uniref:Uncharacterized protein n=1 Tax=Acetivibrio ethanolgignens TaxID=290052 RepID=A0A0V8QEG1_9FIRM|nr:hypothetical protein [Acetivibrio ethanolgignens]KSV58798.1 hypothetical protein ASU35_11475 [Acetivibrio ethanolgignens]